MTIRTSAHGDGHARSTPRTASWISTRPSVWRRLCFDSGTEGLVVCGTTGESPTLSNDEKLALLEATRRGGPRARRGDHRRHDHVQHRRERRAVARGGAPGRRRHPRHGAVLQQPAAGGPVPALPRDCPRGRPADHPLQHPVALAAQHGGRARRCAWPARCRTSSASRRRAPTSSRSARSFAMRPTASASGAATTATS